VQQSLAHVSEADPFKTRTQPPLPPDDGPQPRYRILRHHASGGLSDVYVARDAELNRQVALKEIKPGKDHPHSRSRFLLEAEITGGLEHPGIVPEYGLGHYADGRPYYAMRFIKGDNLAEAIKRFHSGRAGGVNPPMESPVADASSNRGDNSPRSPDFNSLEFRRLLQRFIDVCQAVAYAHSRGVLHRDLKPGHIMLGKSGETLVVDWGLAKARGSPQRERPGDDSERPVHRRQPRHPAEVAQVARDDRGVGFQRDGGDAEVVRTDPQLLCTQRVEANDRRDRKRANGKISKKGHRVGERLIRPGHVVALPGFSDNGVPAAQLFLEADDRDCHARGPMRPNVA
jgi:serine/threonine protein kinase